MSGISYDLSKIKGIVFDVDGVLSPSTIPCDLNGNPMRMVNVKDGYAIQLAAKSGFKMAIITGGRSEAVKHRYEALGIKDIFMNVAHKLPLMTEWIQSNNLTPEEIIYIGDDIPDIKCMKAVGLPCTPDDAAPEVKRIARYISPLNGGYGCVRDILRQVLIANNCWMNEDNAFGW